MVDALLIISLVFGGVAVDVGSRTPTVMYFDLLLPIVLAFRFLWGKWPSISDLPLLLTFLVCLASQALTALTSPGDIYKSILTMKSLLCGFLLYCLLEKRGIREWCVPVWLGLAGSFTLLPFYSAVQGGMNSISAIKDAVVTPMGPNNYVACYLTILTPIAIVILYKSPLGYKKLIYGVCVLVGLAGLFATFSRAAFASLALALLLSIPLMYRSGLGVKHLALAALLIAAVLSMFSQQLVFAYEFVGDKMSVGDEARVELWRKAISTFESNPVFGVGPGQFVNYTHETGADNGRLGAHNTYLQVLAECGIVGSLPVFGLMFLGLWRCFAAARSAYEPTQVAIWIGLLAAIIHNAFDSLFWTQHFQAFFWLFLALSTSQLTEGRGSSVFSDVAPSSSSKLHADCLFTRINCKLELHC